eukprot:CAMPEP_0115559768 /NCGR_PEP_ID=MMETSP0271-20121206/100121_1 /TAXON_ID=71861 /ORGANISM="Scrippsiella trochoidea, Strain CCMP3099" /LENGTH=89 /DNA_ID=CAMNT_0002993819 /DNA_START=327 /DNA_END=593 /DNA_ORIENTATION=-
MTLACNAFFATSTFTVFAAVLAAFLLRTGKGFEKARKNAGTKATAKRAPKFKNSMPASMGQQAAAQQPFQAAPTEGAAVGPPAEQLPAT